MVNLKQMRDLIIEPTLKAIKLYSPEASDLILYTGLYESGYRFLKQIGNGPALSYWQIEPFTLNDIYKHFLISRPDLELDVDSLMYPGTREHNLQGNLFYAVAICRLCYRRSPIALPEVGDGAGMAHIYKEAFNSHLGKGSKEGFENCWDKNKHLIL